MAEATDQQMQTYSDERIRPRAEQVRALFNAIEDDKVAIDDCYARAVGSGDWDDNRTDGPPELADESDILTYNTIISVLIKLRDGTATSQEVSDFAAAWSDFQSMCVRPVQG